MLKPFYQENSNVIEIGVDEAGRGPMLGPVHAAAVILPRNTEFDYSCLKDSKRFHSKKKILEVADYIKTHAIAYEIAYLSEKDIDTFNIRNATHRAMHNAIKKLIESVSKNNEYKKTDYQLLVDGCDFKPLSLYKNNMLMQIPHVCVTKGDNTYCAIAAASILAKTARDEYIEALCKDNPELDERYKIASNKGYGTKAHLEGIEKYGITKYHRQSFGLCRSKSVK